MLRRESDSHGLFTSGETSDHDCELGSGQSASAFERFKLQVGASCGGGDVMCLCEAGPRTLYSEVHTPTPDALLCEHCGKSRVVITRYSEGYGTEHGAVCNKDCKPGN